MGNLDVRSAVEAAWGQMGPLMERKHGYEGGREVLNSTLSHGTESGYCGVDVS